ncbi:M16 family metallopeptidase [Bdellovibrio sp. HCB337]|uniref:M16 family metallopeptidase n=1 Tax=Bdellovibrio sp. HCB337 TaxID=3394358 RepID=UPI0039A6D993
MKTTLLVLLLSFSVFQAHALEKFKNGAPFFAQQDTTLPRNILLLSFQGGPAAVSPAQQGNFLLLSEALNEGPSDRSLKEYKQELFNLGAEVSFRADNNAFQIVVKAPPAEMDKVLVLLKQTLEKPRTSEEDFKRFQGNVLAGVKSGFEDMRSVIFYFAPRDLLSYSAQTRSGDTSPTSFEKLTYDDFKSSFSALNYQRLFASYIGPQATKEVRTKIETTFKNELQKPYKKWALETTSVPKLKKNTYTIVDKPGATDNQVVYLYPQSVRRDGPQWVNAMVNMDVLGGGLHGHLGRTLRTERGLTYGAMSWFSKTTLPVWMAWTFGGVEQTKGLITGVPEVVGKYVAGPLTATELAESKGRLLNSMGTDLELAKDRLLTQSWHYANGLNPQVVDQYVKMLDNTKLADVTKFKNTLSSKAAAVYMMGDQTKLIPILESIGVPKSEIRVVKVTDIL